MKWLYYTLQYLNLSKLNITTGVPGLNRNDIYAINIPLPPLSSQKAISRILDDANSLKEKRHLINSNSSKLLESIFIKMFGDLQTNPKGWKTITLNEICHYIKDGPHVSPNYTREGIPFISVRNIVSGNFDLSDIRYISEEDHKEYCRRCKPQKGDVLYSKGGTTGIAKRIDVDYEFSIWVHLALLKIKNDIVNAEYVEAMLNSEFCSSQARSLTRGIANRDLVLGQMKQIKIMLPPLSLQQKFTSVYEKIESLRQRQLESEKQIQQLVKSLTHKLFKGDIDLSKGEIANINYKVQQETPKNIMQSDLDNFISPASTPKP